MKDYMIVKLCKTHTLKKQNTASAQSNKSQSSTLQPTAFAKKQASVVPVHISAPVIPMEGVSGSNSQMDTEMEDYDAE